MAVGSNLDLRGQTRGSSIRTSYPYIALEGCDGAGKSTVRARISSYLRSRGIPVLEIGQHAWLDIKAARTIIDARENRCWLSPESIINAYSVDKRLHVTHNVVPHLSRAAVLADRCFISDAVYQEALYGLSADLTIDRYLQEGGPLPTLLIYVYVPVSISMERINTRGKQRRHYEREPDLDRISRIYTRVLQTRGPLLAEDFIWFGNEGELRVSFEQYLLPKLDEIMRQIPHPRSGRRE